MPSRSVGHLTNERSTSPPSPTLSWEISHRIIEEAVDDGSMPDPRTRPALAPLAQLAASPAPEARWTWTVARVDAAGRIPLPPGARAALRIPAGLTAEVTGVCHRVALVLGAGGAALTVDRRGRLLLPAWLRDTAPGTLIGTRAQPAPLVLVAPSSILDGFGDVLLGQLR